MVPFGDILKWIGLTITVILSVGGAIYIWVKIRVVVETHTKEITEVKNNSKEQDDKISEQDKVIIKMSGNIDLVLEKLKPLEKLDAMIQKTVEHEVNARELRDLKS